MNTNERPTPETCAAFNAKAATAQARFIHMCETSARLEQQRDEAREKLKSARAIAAEWIKEFRSLRTLCRQLDEDASAMMKQRDELLKALKKQACLTAYYNGQLHPNKPHPNGGLVWENYLCSEARAAIAAMKGNQ